MNRFQTLLSNATCGAISGEVFGCALNDTSVETKEALKAAAAAYMDTEAAAAEVAELAALLRQ
jgi:hypothetical protein